ncbi:MAG: hypothetical protein KA031_03935 [Candidatus Hydrogenedentes bacterium]|nr:hypothetical protein [Candidatus Hydrogenedentota bacterium]
MQRKSHALFNKTCVVLPVLIGVFISGAALAAGTAGNTSPGSTDYPNGGMRRMDSVTIPVSYNDPWSAVLDTENGVAYYGTSADPGRVEKIRLGISVTPPSYVGSSTMNANENDLMCGVIDPENQFAYFGVNTDTPGRVVKVNLSLSYFPRVDGLALSGNLPRSALIDTINGYVYFGTDTSPGQVLKVDVNPARTFEEAGPPLTCFAGEDRFLCAVIDQNHGYAYFGTYTTPGRIVKVALGTAGSGPARIGAVTLNAGEDNLRCAVIDPDRGFAYFGTDTSPGKIIRVALGEGAALPARVDALTLDSGENRLWCATLDSTVKLAWFGTYTNPGNIVKIRLGNTEDAPVRIGALPLTLNTEKSLLSVAGDPEQGYAHFGTQQSSSSSRPVVRVALSQKSFIKGMRISLPETGTVNNVSFYSHTAAGNVRLALYTTSNPPARVWESGTVAITVEKNWLTLPISAGVPASLELAAGDYYLAWQVDTNASVPGYIQSGTGTGFYVPFLWDSFPALLQGDTAPVSTDETWSAYLTYGMSAEGEGETPDEGEGEPPVEGEGEPPAEGEGETPVEGEGEAPAEGEGEEPVEGEGEMPAEGEPPAEGEGETPVEGEGEMPAEGEPPAEGEGEAPVEGEGEMPAEGEGEVTPLFALEYTDSNPVYALSGDRVELTVTPVNSVGAVQYRWYHSAFEKSFQPLPDALESTLILVPVTKAHAGRYQCRATDATGQAQSPEIVVHVDVKLPLHSAAILALVILALGLSGARSGKALPVRHKRTPGR